MPTRLRQLREEQRLIKFAIKVSDVLIAVLVAAIIACFCILVKK
jgi:hypothetical protein